MFPLLPMSHEAVPPRSHPPTFLLGVGALSAARQDGCMKTWAENDASLVILRYSRSSRTPVLSGRPCWVSEDVTYRNALLSESCKGKPSSTWKERRPLFFCEARKMTRGVASAKALCRALQPASLATAGAAGWHAASIRIAVQARPWRYQVVTEKREAHATSLIASALLLLQSRPACIYIAVSMESMEIAGAGLGREREPQVQVRRRGRRNSRICCFIVICLALRMK